MAVSNSYFNSAGFLGATNVLSNLYVLGPIVERKMACLCPFSLTLFATKNCSSLSSIEPTPLRLPRTRRPTRTQLPSHPRRQICNIVKHQVNGTNANYMTDYYTAITHINHIPYACAMRKLFGYYTYINLICTCRLPE